MDKWIFNRLFKTKKRPQPRFAYQSTVSWMRALAILCRSDSFSNKDLKAFYKNVQRRRVDIQADTWVYKNILMALQNIAALNEMSSQKVDHNAIAISAIITWYYAIYYSSSAMIAATSGSTQKTHAGTIKLLHEDIISKKLAVGPFGLSLETLVPKKVESNIKSLKNGTNFKLIKMPTNETEAWGAAYSYLSGTADHEKEKKEEDIKKDNKEFKNLGVSNFLGGKAKHLRDLILDSGRVNFLTQSYRYRLKANYKDPIYLAYGENRTESIKVLVEDLNFVAVTYLKMACHYVSKRVEKGTWVSFIEDLEQNLTVDIDLNIIKT